MPGRPVPMPRPTPQPKSIYACFLPPDLCGARTIGAAPSLYACMPAAPIQRSRSKCHCPLAGAAFIILLQCKTRHRSTAFVVLFLPSPTSEASGGSRRAKLALRIRGVGGGAALTEPTFPADRPPTPDPSSPLCGGRGEEGDGSNQLAAAAGMSRWRFMTILLSAP